MEESRFLSINKVMKKLEETYGNVYSTKNVLLSATHTHSTPGGFMQYFLFNIASKGFVEQTLYSLVNGIVQVNLKFMFSNRHSYVHSFRMISVCWIF